MDRITNTIEFKMPANDSATKKWRKALAQLQQAASYAEDLAQSSWNFAIEKGSLQRAGLTNNDLRWLMAKGFVEHAVEVSRRNLTFPRKFRNAGALALCDGSSFILTKTGLAFAKSISAVAPEPVSKIGKAQALLAASIANGSTASGSMTTLSLPAAAVPTASIVPRWDRNTRTLWFGVQLVKRFKVPAANQELVLTALEEEGWPNCIDDPLPPARDIDSKRRLHDTIVRLNRSHRHRFIRFHGNGNGLAVHWQRV